MNIEGGEFQGHELIKQGLIKNISHLQVQFHNVSKNSRKDRLKIRKESKKRPFVLIIHLYGRGGI